jgi:hypothetical protein
VFPRGNKEDSIILSHLTTFCEKTASTLTIQISYFS